MCKNINGFICFSKKVLMQFSNFGGFDAPEEDTDIQNFKTDKMRRLIENFTIFDLTETNPNTC